ncbi:LytR/AlgR family response regulator transcription factor [Shewanella glacialimarina]|jgi:two-component system response regulator LytT|uniref:LytR/AlgR family response regulator transcription factor n=1 Tax=Shewanella glacialimarina TaxID=2590884 RepID=UPI001CF7FFC6|nr:LytTR family DNA-binding domain-containing protein [Shewanella glacialimarina]UCX05740.1 response regulator transcription factor [Shewanella glacialimarina]
MVIVIVEDEPLIQQRILRLTSEILVEQNPKIICFDDIDDAESFLSENSIDVLLLDLNLMGRDGFALLKNKLAAAFHTIIISAYADKAIEAFEYGVLDFIAKPFSKERLIQAFERLLQNRRSEYQSCKYLSVKKAGEIQLISLENIDYIQADGHYTWLNLNSPIDGSKKILHSKNIEKINQLLPESFIRVHRSYLVNMRKVKSLKLQEGSKYTLLLNCGDEVPVGRTKYEQVKKLIAT